MLRAADGYVSGQQICDRFHVSRTAVWKVIEQLKEEGYEIEAVRRRGYHLTGSPDVMSKAEIESRIETKWAGRNVFYYEETDSTNTRAKAWEKEGAAHGTLAAADAQRCRERDGAAEDGSRRPEGYLYEYPFKTADLTCAGAYADIGHGS